MIAIIDYEAGNLTSVERAVRRLGHDCAVTRDHDRILSAEKVIFPGVGAAGSAMASLRKLGLDQVLRQVRSSGVPLLGICVGAQIIFDHSEEDGGTDCLGLLPGAIHRFSPDLLDGAGRIKVPHMGWNSVVPVRDHPVLRGLADGAEFYFVHSYYVRPAEDRLTLARTSYGLEFSSMVADGNLVATQFHLEKSGRPGLQILDNFCKWDGKDA